VSSRYSGNNRVPRIPSFFCESLLLTYSIGVESAGDFSVLLPDKVGPMRGLMRCMIFMPYSFASVIADCYWRLGG
jgi:hypothetical protein